jgi:uncharacterized protein
MGRMALTNYLMQTVICCFIFMNYGFGWFAKVGQVYLMLIGIGIYFFKVLFSHWWFGWFRFGPMEWLWRSATYWKWQPMKK